MTLTPSPERQRAAIAAFLNACTEHQIAFEPQAAYGTQAEAEAAAREFWERFCELHRAIGRQPPSAMNVPGGVA